MLIASSTISFIKLSSLIFLGVCITCSWETLLAYWRSQWNKTEAAFEIFPTFHHWWGIVWTKIPSFYLRTRCDWTRQKQPQSWSCDPTGSPIISCSTWIASKARRLLVTTSPFKAYKALSKPTVNDELDPIPTCRDIASMNDLHASFLPHVLQTSRAEGWTISSTVCVSSLLEYLMRNLWSKNGEGNGT